MNTAKLMHRWKTVAWRESKRLGVTRRNRIARLTLLEEIRKLQNEIVSLQKNSQMLSSDLENIGEYVFLRVGVVLFVWEMCTCCL